MELQFALSWRAKDNKKALEKKLRDRGRHQERQQNEDKGSSAVFNDKGKFEVIFPTPFNR